MATADRERHRRPGTDANGLAVGDGETHDGLLEHVVGAAERAVVGLEKN